MPRIGFRGRSEFLDSLQKRNGGVNPSYKSRGALAHPRAFSENKAQALYRMWQTTKIIHIYYLGH